jgi:DDE superfamily endonuclease
MTTQGYRYIPDVLFRWTTFLCQALPSRSIPTFLELLFGALLTSTGFVTEAYLALTMHRHWGSYYKWLQTGRWSWLALGLQLTRLVGLAYPMRKALMVIDDTVVLRSSTKAPSVAIHHQHGRKCNRPDYVRGQCWVSLSTVLTQGQRSVAIPLLNRLTRQTGNTNKLDIAITLLRAVRSVVQGAIVLLDSWYMRQKVISHATRQGYGVIGQVRKDTALYACPVLSEQRQRGRPRRYGEKYVANKVATLPEQRTTLTLYGKPQIVRYRSAVVLARFLGGQKVKAVWVQFEDGQCHLRDTRLLLSTLAELSAEEILQFYEKRWCCEPMFNQLKHAWGLQETWQQTRQVLHRWVQMVTLAYALPQLLALLPKEQLEGLCQWTPWRTTQPITAGRIRLGLHRILWQVSIRDWWNPKSRIFEPPDIAMTAC